MLGKRPSLPNSSKLTLREKGGIVVHICPHCTRCMPDTGHSHGRPPPRTTKTSGSSPQTASYEQLRTFSQLLFATGRFDELEVESALATGSAAFRLLREALRDLHPALSDDRLDTLAWEEAAQHMKSYLIESRPALTSEILRQFALAQPASTRTRRHPRRL